MYLENWDEIYAYGLVSTVAQSCLTVTPWATARQASLSITYSQSLLKLLSIELVMPSNHLILCHPLFLLPSIFPSIRVFSDEWVLCIRWPKYWVEIQKPHEFPQASIVNVGKMPVETNDLQISEILISGLLSHIIFFSFKKNTLECLFLKYSSIRFISPALKTKTVDHTLSIWL